tara:strand:+ start:58 stop:279 length:222 start_codon:yes stop_codon:yes gene_type:complete
MDKNICEILDKKIKDCLFGTIETYDTVCILQNNFKKWKHGCNTKKNIFRRVSTVNKKLNIYYLKNNSNENNKE